MSHVGSWADDGSDQAASENLPQQMSQVKLDGLSPEDKTAEVEIQGVNKQDAETLYKSAKTFAELRLSENLLKGVAEMGFTNPSKIQGQALPIIMSKERKNLIGQAQHGSGKTGAFSLGLLSTVDENLPYPQVLVLCPTRELATQVGSVIQKLAKFTKIEVLLAVKDSERGKTTKQVVVGNEGTIDGKLKHKDIDGRKIRMLVLDEADELLGKQGAVQSITRIKALLSPDVQVLLFSATYPDTVRNFAAKVAPGAATITIKRADIALDNIKQYYISVVSEDARYQLLKDIYALLEIGQSIIFVQTKATAKSLSDKMVSDGFKVSRFAGDMEPKQRDSVMEDFRTGRTTVLIATNVLSRGIDVPQVTLVVNYEVPVKAPNDPTPEYETYSHRIGRSGRYGRKGVAINFVVSDTDRKVLVAIAKYYNKDILELKADDIESISQHVKDDLGK